MGNAGTVPMCGQIFWATVCFCCRCGADTDLVKVHSGIWVSGFSTED